MFRKIVSLSSGFSLKIDRIKSYAQILNNECSSVLVDKHMMVVVKQKRHIFE